ncbi:MAG: tetratricopeptide repeat protein [Bacteroidetes bacterium]|nr:tetratricopeptide repeat protein [Bacteroidota bacterium]
MNIESLKALLNQAEEHNLKDNFDEAEVLTNQVLTEIENPQPDLLLGEESGRKEEPSPVGRGHGEGNAELHGFALITLCRVSLRRGDFQTALTHACKALDVAEEHNIIALKARALNAIGAAYLKFADYDTALTYLHKSLAINEELGNEEERARNLSNIGFVYYSLSDNAKALEYFQTSLALYEELDSKYDIAINYTNIGNVYHDLSDYANALEYHQKSLAINEETGNKNGIAADFNNIGRVYDELGSTDKALEYFHKAMAINQETGNKAWLAINLINIGLVYSHLSDYAQTLTYLHKSLAISEELGNKDLVASSLTNIGWNMYLNRSDYTEAFRYMQRALTLYEETGSKEGIARNFGNIGVVCSAKEFAGYNPVRAEEYLLKSLTISREIGNKKIEYEAYQYLADLYKNEQRWEEAHKYLEQFIALEKETLNMEAKNQANLLEQRRQAAEREKSLAIERADAEATKRLLHKTLPRSIADRVIKGEERIADHFESTSILFADVVGFTEISSKMPPAAVLAFMNFIFEHFDALAAKHGCERIKTIGDGYMAVCGAPVRYPNHAQRLALMALDMMEDIKLPEEIREHLPVGTLFHLRIGLHCGEITAGLIGTGKLAYDIYGDAVNTAARMESHGEAGRIQVSEEFRNALISSTLNELPIQFIPRGEMVIKGKGKMKTYFLEKAKQ